MDKSNVGVSGHGNQGKSLLAAIERRRKATKLKQLNRSKRRTIYYYNLHHPVKMYA